MRFKVHGPATVPSKCALKRATSLGVFDALLILFIGAVNSLPCVCDGPRGGLAGTLLSWKMLRNSIHFLFLPEHMKMGCNLQE